MVSNIGGTILNHSSALCENCFQLCSSSKLKKKYQELCYDYCAACITMPTKRNWSLKSIKKNFPPFLCTLIFNQSWKIYSVANDPEKSHSRLIEKHTQSGYCFAAVENDCSSLVRYRLKRGPDFTIDFVDQMQKLARDVHNRKQQHRVFSGTIPTDKQKSKAKSSRICERDFDDSDLKFLGHCH